jgi:hypothetical protein
MNRATEHNGVGLEQVQLGGSIHVLHHIFSLQCNAFLKLGLECTP